MLSQLKAQEGRYRILGFVDDDPRMQRMRVQGSPVLGGYDSLVSLVTSGVVDTVVISARIIEVERFLHENIPAKERKMIIAEMGLVPDWSSAYTLNAGTQDTGCGRSSRS